MPKKKDERLNRKKLSHKPLFDEELNEALKEEVLSVDSRKRNGSEKNGISVKSVQTEVTENVLKGASVFKQFLMGKKSHSIVTVCVAALVAISAIASVAASAIIAANGSEEKESENNVTEITEIVETNETEEAAVEVTGEEPTFYGAETPTEGQYTFTVKFYGRDDVSCKVNEITVGEALVKCEITLTEAQLKNVDTEEIIKADKIISVDVVTTETVDVEETLDFDTVYNTSSSIPEGECRITQEGVVGRQTRRFEVTFVNGVEVSREQVGSWVDAYEQDQIITTGTGGVTNSSSESNTVQTQVGGTEGGTIVGSDGVERRYKYYVDVRATCYYAGGTTAIGLPADENVIGVDPSVFPYWTKVYVCGEYGDFGERIVADTGFISGYKIDICLNADNPLAYGFGWRDMRVYVLE